MSLRGLQRAVWPSLAALVSVMRWRVVWVLGLMVALSLSEGMGLVLLVPLLHFIGLDVQQGRVGPLARGLAAVFTWVGVRPSLVTVLGLYVLVVSVSGLLQRWQATGNAVLQQEVVTVLRGRLYRLMAHTDWLFFARHRAAEFTHVLTSEMDRVGAATYYLLRLVAAAILTVVYVGVAWQLSAALTGVALACAGGLCLLLRGRLRVARAIGEGVSYTMRSLYATIAEHLSGMKVAKSYGAEDRHVAAFGGFLRQSQRLYVSAIRNQAGSQHGFEIGSVTLLSLILWVSVEVLGMPAAQILILLFLFARLMPRFADMLQSGLSLLHCLPAFSAVLDLQHRCEAAAETPPQAVEPLALRHSVQLEGVSFGYEGTAVIRDLHMTIRAGETVGLVGPSGAGKSTMADLLMGLLVPDQGQVLVDGVPLGPNTRQSWRDQVSYVPQETFLFHDTIRANLLLARPDATAAELEQALTWAAADAFVSKPPHGIDTVVGERGMRVSGGERQRLALARALIRQPAFLILDEATSALDSASETLIQQALRTLHGQMTIVIISHRLSTVREVDTLYVLEEGHVVDSGRWEELRESGRLHAFYRAQLADAHAPHASPATRTGPCASARLDHDGDGPHP